MRITSYGEKIPAKQRNPQKAISRAKNNGKNILARSTVSSTFQSSYLLASENQSFFPETNQYNLRRSLRGWGTYPTVISPNQLSSSSHNSTCDASCRKAEIIGCLGLCLVLLPTICAIVIFTKDKVASALSKAKEKIASVFSKAKDNICSGFARIKECVNKRGKTAPNNPQANNIGIATT